MGSSGGDDSGSSSPDTKKDTAPMKSPMDGYRPDDVRVETLAPALGPTRNVATRTATPLNTGNNTNTNTNDTNDNDSGGGIFSAIGNAIKSVVGGVIDAAPSIAANTAAFALGGPVGVMGLNATRGVIGQVDPTNPLGQSIPETVTGMIAPNMNSIGKSVAVSTLGAGMSGKYAQNPQNPNTVSGAIGNLGSTVDNFMGTPDEESMNKGGTFANNIQSGGGTMNRGQSGTVGSNTIVGTSGNSMGYNFNDPNKPKGFGRGFY